MLMGIIFSNKDVWITSLADEVFLNPQGMVSFKGLHSEVLYYKDLQDNTGVKMEVIRHGDYKSAVEPFMDNKMSDANRKQLKELLGSIWGELLEDVSEGRDIPVDSLNSIADNLSARTPKSAVAVGLIDELLYNDEYEQKLADHMGVEVDDMQVVTMETYAGNLPAIVKKYKGDDKIAVVYAQGKS